MAKSNISDAKALDLIEAALEIEKMDAKDAGSISYMPRILVQTSLPYRDPKVDVYKRVNGAISLTLFSPEGVPFGTVPRFVVSWLATQATLTQSPVISLGHSQADFLRNLGMRQDGKDVARLHKQSLRFFNTMMSLKVDDAAQLATARANIMVSSRSFVAWHPKNKEQRGLWESNLTLTDEFFKECVTHPIPVDLRVLNALSSSPMAMDVYTWMTYRIAICRKPSLVPWSLLQAQFGNADAQLLKHFKQAFERALKLVLTIWSPAITVEKEGITIYPSLPHIAVNKGRRSIEK
jgi:hypothetical protein